MSELAKQLRFEEGCWDDKVLCLTLIEAAEELERLQADNDKLRGDVEKAIQQGKAIGYENSAMMLLVQNIDHELTIDKAIEMLENEARILQESDD